MQSRGSIRCLSLVVSLAACGGDDGGGATETTGSATSTGGATTDLTEGPSSSATTADTTTASDTADDSTTTGAVTSSAGSITDSCVTGCWWETTGDTGTTTVSDPCPDPASKCGNGEMDWDCGEECDLGAANSEDGECTPQCRGAICGDGLLHPGVEQCDDGDTDPADGCPNHCGNPFVYTPPRLVAGAEYMCALSNTGKVRCWGSDGNKNGVLGYGSTQTIGDQPGEMPPPDVDLGGTVIQLVSGGNHNCALLAGGTVRCWGFGGTGALGYGSSANIGDQPGEMPPPDVDVGGEVVQIAAGEFATCALLKSGAVRCWGAHLDDDIGDQPGEMPPPDILVSGKIAQIHANRDQGCVLRENGSVACWYTDHVPSEIAYGDFVVELSGGVCGRLADGALRCVGYNDFGQKGFPDTFYVGSAIDYGDVPVGGAVKRAAPGTYHTCAILGGGNVRCWGMNASGELGYGHTIDLGHKAGEMPTPDVALGGAAVEIATAVGHTCAILVGGKIRCWGAGGRLGLGHTQTIGDQPGEMPPPDVPVF